MNYIKQNSEHIDDCIAEEPQSILTETEIYDDHNSENLQNLETEDADSPKTFGNAPDYSVFTEKTMTSQDFLGLNPAQIQFQKICKRTWDLQQGKSLLLPILHKRIYPLKAQITSQVRSDVIMKKILRCMSSYFDSLLEREYDYKGKGKKNPQSFLTYCDQIVEKKFETNFIQLFEGQDTQTVANNLAAILQPKILMKEIDNLINKDDRDQLVNIESKQNLCQQNVTYNNRLLQINDKMLKYRALDTRYTIKKLVDFLDSPENLIIFHHYLRRSNYLITQALGCKILQQESVNLNIDKLTVQVPKTQRQKLFGEACQKQKLVSKRVAKQLKKELDKDDKDERMPTGIQASIDSFKSISAHMEGLVNQKIMDKLSVMF